jgi:hypothetical protein
MKYLPYLFIVSGYVTSFAERNMSFVHNLTAFLLTAEKFVEPNINFPSFLRCTLGMG